jgi:hypothetical protein
MTEPTGDRPDRKLEELELDTETVQDLTRDEADEVKGGLLLKGGYSATCLAPTVSKLCAVRDS